MTDETNNDPFGEDQEMLDAIAAAFGPDAVDMLQANIVNDDGEGSLNGMVAEIDESLSATETTEQTNADADEEVDVERYIMVEIGGSRFGVPMCNVLEIQRVPQITFLPNVPNWVNGVVNLRGTVLSVADLQMILKMPESNVSQTSRRLIVTQSLLDEVDAGLIVDRVLGIRNVPQDRIEDPTAPINDDIAAYLTGVYALDDEIVCLLDVEKLLLSEAFRQFESA